jgi:hypothetical protein
MFAHRASKRLPSIVMHLSRRSQTLTRQPKGALRVTSGVKQYLAATTGDDTMIRFGLVALSVLVAFPMVDPALAAPVKATGPSALALAAVIAEHSTLVRAHDQRVIRRLFGGNTNFGFTPNRTISVTADSITCKTGNVDITSRSCDLTFSVGKRALTGREANEISATALAAGATSEGAAGSIIESLSKVVCTIDPNEIMKKAGGGAECTFETGQ